MTGQHGENDPDREVVALSELIDQWWETEEQRTVHHDGVELIASIALARFLLDSDVVIPPVKNGD